MKEKPVYEGNHSRLWWWDCIFTRKIVSMLPAAVALSAGWRNVGLCIMKNSMQHIGALIGQSDPLIIISQCCYGGYSSPSKATLDREIWEFSPVPCSGVSHSSRRILQNNLFRFLLCELFNKRLCRGKTKSICFGHGAKGQEPLGMLKSESTTGRCSGY